MSTTTPLPRIAPSLLLFACAAGLSVANVYYAQPLLDALSADLRVGRLAGKRGLCGAWVGGSVLGGGWGVAVGVGDFFAGVMDV